MKKNLTELVFILDRSGSMAGWEKETIGGFNAMIAKQRQEEGEAFISTVLFDNTSEVIHDQVALDRVPRLTEKEYYVRGCTALLDAVGGAIHHIGNVHKYAREEERTANYHADSQGTSVIYEAVNDTVCDFRANRPMCADWRRKIDEDNHVRSDFGRYHRQSLRI